eukprot:271972-Chlamydomonas_euryale.AAC.1
MRAADAADLAHQITADLAHQITAVDLAPLQLHDKPHDSALALGGWRGGWAGNRTIRRRRKLRAIELVRLLSNAHE